MLSTWRDVRHTLRVLGRERAFAAIVIITLAVAIGGNTAVFSVVEGVLLKPLPYPGADRLVTIYQTHPRVPIFPVTPGDYWDYRAQNRTFEDIAVFGLSEHEYAGAAGPENLQGLIVSQGFFEILGYGAMLGRTFSADDVKLGQREMVIVSQKFWRDRLGGDPSIIGKSVTLSRRPFEVIGVMSPGLQHIGGGYRSLPHGETAEFWVPWRFNEAKLARGQHYLNAVGRLKPNIGIEQAKADLNRIAAVLETQYPQSRQWRAVVVPLREELVGHARPLLLVAFGSAAFVLLIACANLACMLLARGIARSREYALRLALGADRRHVFGQGIIEAIVLSVAGTVLAIPLAIGGVRLLLALAPENLPRRHMIEVDAGMLLFAAIITPLAAVLFGFLPALRASHTDPESALRAGGRALTAGRSGLRTHELLVCAEIALCLMVLAGAGLLARTFYNLKQAHPGFRSDGVLTASIDIPGNVYGPREKRVAFYTRLLQEVRSQPSVQSAGLGVSVPFTGFNDNSSFEIIGKTFPPGQEPGGRYHEVSSGYFESLGIPIREGREILDSDTATSEPVIVINDALAKRYFPGENPVGRVLNVWDTRRKIVGVAGDVKDMPVDVAAVPAYYRPITQMSPFRLRIAIRVQGDPKAAEPILRRVAAGLDPNVPVFQVKTMQDVADDAIALQRFAFVLFATFAGIATLLAAVGVYGVMSYATSRRRQEFGIRIALGARTRDILELVFTRAFLIAITGVIGGIGGALALTRLIESYLYGVQARDTGTLLIVALLLLVVVLKAAWIPARRAAGVNTASLLRAE